MLQRLSILSWKATKRKAKDQKEKGVNPDRDINATCQEAAVKVQEVKLAVTTAGANPVELYDNLRANEARQSWEKVIKS